MKRGLQELCALLEAKVRVPASYRSEVLRTLSRHIDSFDTFVRRWAYKAIGLLGEKSFVPALRGKIARYENDPENVTWAVAAFRRLAPPTRTFETNPLLNVSESAIKLASGYFLPSQRPGTLRSLRQAVDEQDRLSLLWASLLFGVSDGRLASRRAKPLIQDLNQHDDPLVVEYSIWALNEVPSAQFSDIQIYPQSLDEFPPNVRRWFFRLLTKDRDTLYGNMSMVERTVTSDQEVGVREGIAIGIRPHHLEKSTAEFIVDWFDREQSDIVRAQLIRHFVRHQDTSVYRDALQRESRLPRDEMSSLLLPSVRLGGATNFIVGGLGGRNVSKKGADVRMATKDRHQTYVVAVDTVDFSSEEDADQLVIFDDLLGAVALLQLDDVIDRLVLMTGDGLILALRGKETAALKAAVELYSKWRRSKKKGIRVGVNSGPVYWIDLNDGSRQLIGHAVNWAVRVMSAVVDSGISISETYYEQCIVPAKSEFRGLQFQIATGRTTKKGEEVKAFDVMLSDDSIK